MNDVHEALREAERLESMGLLTERQAQAYLLRDVYGFDRRTAADEMGVSPSRVDNARRDAHSKIAAAKTTMNMIERVNERIDFSLEQCAECGEPMDEFTFQRGRPICLDCAESS